MKKVYKTLLMVTLLICCVPGVKAQNKDLNFEWVRIVNEALQYKKDNNFRETPFEILNDYCRDRSSADEKYKNKILYLIATYGTAMNITDGTFADILLSGDINFPGVIVNFPKDKWRKVDFLHSVVKIRGKCLGIEEHGEVRNIVIQGEELHFDKKDQFSENDWLKIEGFAMSKGITIGDLFEDGVYEGGIRVHN